MLARDIPDRSSQFCDFQMQPQPTDEWTLPEVRPFDKDSLALPAQQIGPGEVGSLRAGNFSYTTPNATYQGFLQPGGPARLFVLLSSAGWRNGGVTFTRVSWGRVLNGTVLNIEDPSFARHPGIWTGWYYGTRSLSYLREIADFVRALAAERGIDTRNIVFIGSSAGGYAALYLADAIAGSTAFGFNPQLRPGITWSAERFQRIADVDLKGDDPFGRNDLARIAGNTKSRFFLSCNTASGEDINQQIGPWLDKAGIARDRDATHSMIAHNTCTIFLFHLPSQNRHRTFPDIEHLAVLLPVIMEDDPIRHDRVWPVFESVIRTIQLDDQRDRLGFWVDALQQLYGSGLERVEADKARLLRAYHPELPAGWSFKLEANAGFDRFTPSIVVRDTVRGRQDGFRDSLDAMAADRGARLTSGPDWFALVFPAVQREKAMPSFAGMIEESLGPIRDLCAPPKAHKPD